jgi:hypothetical protein
MTDEKRCPSCKQWTQWERLPEDRCAHCDAPLMVGLPRTQTAETERNEANRPIWLEAKATDGKVMRIVRNVALMAHIVYAGIMALIMMLFAALVH